MNNNETYFQNGLLRSNYLNNNFLDLNQEEYDERVYSIRELRKDEEDFSQLMNRLPRRPLNHSSISSGHIMYITVELKGNPTKMEVDELREKLIKLYYVMVCRLNTQANGFNLSIRIVDLEKHYFHFLKLKKDFEAMNLIVDELGIQDSYLPTYSIDKNEYYNSEAQTYMYILVPDDFKSACYKFNHIITLKNRRPRMQFGKLTRIDYEKFDLDLVFSELIPELIKTKANITKDREDQMTVASFLSKVFREDGREMFHNICKFNYLNNPEKEDQDYNLYLKCKNLHDYKNKEFFDILKKYNITIKD